MFNNLLNVITIQSTNEFLLSLVLNCRGNAPRRDFLQYISLVHIKIIEYSECQRFSRAVKRQEEKRERGEKTSGCPRQLIDLTMPTDLN